MKLLRLKLTNCTTTSGQFRNELNFVGTVKKSVSVFVVFAILVWASSSFASCESELIHSEKKLVETLVELNMDWAEGLFQEIVKKHPIEKSEYIFVGRSPALLAAYLEVQKMLFPRIQSWTLPISLKGQRDIPREQLKDRFEKMMSSLKEELSFGNHIG